MKTITLKKMEITNFKGITTKEIDFSPYTRIVGANATGKSTIYEAYLWCLFGKSASGADCFVQPLDNSGEPIHKMTTEVVLHLDIDGTTTVLKRRLEEQWSVPRGTKEEVLKGTPTTYFVNDVPCKASEYNAKIDAICPAVDWMMMSNISTFNAMKMEEKRQKLNAIAKQVTDKVVAADGFPFVQQALDEGKTIEEFKREIKAKRDKSKKELDEIPARIDQQEKLRITDVDFAACRLSATQIEGEIKKIDSQLQAEISTQTTSEVDELNRQYKDLAEDKINIEISAGRELTDKRSKVENEIQNISHRKQLVANELNALLCEVERLKSDKESYAQKFDVLRNEWTAINSSKFEENMDPVCPQCLRPYTAAELGEMQTSAIERFNSHKLLLLTEKQQEATKIKSLLDHTNNSLSEATDKFNKQTEMASQLDADMQIANRELGALPTIDVIKEANKEYQTVCKKLEAIQSAIRSLDVSKPVNSELKERKEKLQLELSRIQSTIGKEAINEQIDAQRKTLDLQSKTLAQAVSDMDKVEFEIAKFCKRKIELVEASVSSHFSIVKWKMYEQNITNDGDRAICEALVDGVPYAQLNTAMRINAGLDICTGLSKALGISAPIFIDNKESVTDLMSTTQQLITLEVAQGQSLTIINQ